MPENTLGPRGVRFAAPAEGWNQNRQRGLGLFYDQHLEPERFPIGRPWWCYTERPADGASVPMPVGELMPYNWIAPWIPESKYMLMSMGSLSTNRFTIQYDRMISDLKTAWDEYYQRAAAEAAALQLPIPDHGDAITFKLKAIVGAPPRTYRLAEAAQAGDRWLLGFTPVVNEYLQRLIISGDGRIGRPEDVPIEQFINKGALEEQPPAFKRRTGTVGSMNAAVG